MPPKIKTYGEIYCSGTAKKEGAAGCSLPPVSGVILIYVKNIEPEIRRGALCAPAGVL